MFKKLIVFAAFCSLTACGLETYSGGELPPPSRLARIKPGQTYDHVVETLGPPGFESKADGLLVYARNKKSSRVFWDPEETERDVHIYAFDKAGKLTGVRRLTLADGKAVPYNPRATAVSDKELSVLRQLADNFGKYDAGGTDSSVRR